MDRLIIELKAEASPVLHGADELHGNANSAMPERPGGKADVQVAL